MELLVKQVKKYLGTLTLALVLVLTMTATAFATEGTAQKSADTQAELSEKETQMLDILEHSVLSADTVTYDGALHKPVWKLIYTDTEKEKETDVTGQFVIQTEDTGYTDAGSYKCAVKVTGYYDQNKEVSFTAASVVKEGTFRIEQADFKAASVELKTTKYTYDGKAKKPAVSVATIQLRGETRTLSAEDYTVSYKNNINAGTASAVITGQGNYKGSVTLKYKINPLKLSDVKNSVALSTSKYAYNGKNRTPGTTVRVKLSSVVTLKKNTDYTVSYSKDCKSIGPKTVTIKGKGNYTGTLKKNYSVVPEQATGLGLKERSTTALKVTCKKAKTSSCKYQFLMRQYNASKGKWEDVKTINTSSNVTTFKGLTPGRAYATYVRIYKKVDGKNYVGAWSKVGKTVTQPAKPVISRVVKSGSTSMKVTWKAVSSGASGYEIQYSTKSNFSSAKTVRVSGRSTTSVKIKVSSGKAYYARVRTIRNYNNKTYRSAWSSKLSTSYSNVFASYSTTYSTSNKNRCTNLRLACKAINGTILSNGKTFSFNGIVGERTAAKGYKEAIIYEGGQEVGGIGGGICQVATTLFNAALRANFQIVERHQHSLTVHYCPLGYDAAVAWGSKNLRFKNNSGTSVKVACSASGGTLSVKFLISTAKKPPKVTTKVTVRNGVYTLKRYVNGKCNYTTTSDYLDN